MSRMVAISSNAANVRSAPRQQVTSFEDVP
jgi:hypothetical protein